MNRQSARQRHTGQSGAPTAADLFVSDETLVLRNYDGTATHEVTVRFHDATGELAFERAYTLSPGSVLSVTTRLERGVYRVEARVDGGQPSTLECLVGSGPDETALVEIGNGLLCVSEGAR
jgi:hypothetical protein